MKFITSLYSFLSENRYLLPIGVAILTIVMLLLTLVPSDFLGKSNVWSYDKAGHIILFGSWCFIVGLYFQINSPSQVNLWGVFASGTVFGLLIEILQYLLPLKRHADPIDFLCDVIGCLVAVWVLKNIRPEKSGKVKQQF